MDVPAGDISGPGDKPPVFMIFRPERLDDAERR
jgi:hypothetical protein